MIVCTITCADDLHKAMTWAKSVKAHMPPAKVVLCLVEKTIHPAAGQCPYFDEVVLAKNIGIRQFPQFLFKYSLKEGACAVKAQFFRYLLHTFKDETHLIYMDPDIKVLHPFDELKRAMDTGSIVLTPHFLELEGSWPHALHLYGMYNLGFIAMTRSEETDRFLAWWADRLYDYCLLDETFFADQKWIDLAPAFFNVHILKHPAYNVASWNLHEKARRIARMESGAYFLADTPLVFFHFSGIWGGLQWHMEQAIPDRRNAIYTLLDEYLQEIEEMGRQELEKEPWSYDYFESGERISDETRKRYKNNPEFALRYPDPYTASNHVFT